MSAKAPWDRCICIAGDPCDYHAASCVTCERPCKGHPNEPTQIASLIVAEKESEK